MKEEFKDRLKKAMEEKEMSASELSRLSGVGKSDISYYLKGRYVAKQDKVYMLAKALDVDPGWLITGVEPQNERDRTLIIPDSDLFRKIILGMNPDDYRIVMTIFEKTEREMRARGKL